MTSSSPTLSAGSAAARRERRPEIHTLATVDARGGGARVDLVHGGLMPGDPGAGGALDVARRQFLRRLMSLRRNTETGAFESIGRDLDGDLADIDGDGIPDVGFDTYAVGMPPGGPAIDHRRIVGANNLYDLFQVLSGPPDVDAISPGFAGFTGGDISGDSVDDGGPGLFSNRSAADFPTLPPLPYVMGTGRGPQRGEQHQFVQIVFPYDLDRSSLFDHVASANSFLGDSAPGAAPNVFIEKRWVTRNGLDSIVDHTVEHAHVSGIAIIGGVAAVPVSPGSVVLSTIDVVGSQLPEAVKTRVLDDNVFTYIAHEDPSALVTNPDGHPQGFIDAAGVLHLPDPTDLGGSVGGRVFGANSVVPDAVNDFGVTGDALAARVGFVSIRIAALRTATGLTVDHAYFHTFPVSQLGVGGDPSAPDGGFDRGPAIEVNALSLEPAIGVVGNSDPFDPELVVSTRARFRIEFDKEVIPDSVGFSRGHTIHSTPGGGIVLPFSGNSEPVRAPGPGAPLAASIYLAVNQPAQVAVNNPFAKSANPGGLTDAGLPILPGATPAQQAALNGLSPREFNVLASLPRGIIPIDVRPVDQNNLQAYIIEPLVELPPGSVVTLGVCVAGLGLSNNDLTGPPPTNRGNFTRSGTVFTSIQGLTPVGLPLDASQATGSVANATVIKVNAGPMDLTGRLFYGGTNVAFDTLIDGDVGNDQTTGGFNVSRSFRVADDATRPLINAPVAPEALYVGFDDGAAGIVDLAGRGMTTNAPGASPVADGVLAVSRYLPTTLTGSTTTLNWSSIGSINNGDHQSAFGITGRYTAGGCSFCPTESYESELAIGAAVGLGPATPTPGVNEGSSGREQLVRDSRGSDDLRAPGLGSVGDMVVGDFLDRVYFDAANPYARNTLHFSHNLGPGVFLPNNSIADPPLPNPPPRRLAVGLPATAVLFDQRDLGEPPFVIDGNEVFPRDEAVCAVGKAGPVPFFSHLTNGLIHLNPAFSETNPHPFDVPHLPNGGFLQPSFCGATVARFAQTGPLPQTSTAPAVVLSVVNAALGAGTVGAQDLVIPGYASRQQIGNFLFVTDRTNKRLHAVNSNSMEVLASLDLPDPRGLGLTPDLALLCVSNEGDDSVSLVDADPTSATFMTEFARLTVGDGPRAVAAAPNGLDIHVLNRLGNTISIIDVPSRSVRRTLTSALIDRPADIALGAIEDPSCATHPGFGSGTYHGFIANQGGDNVLIYESGPAGVSGIGFDDIIGSVTAGPGMIPIVEPLDVAFDPSARLDLFSNTIGCFVAHAGPDGEGVVSRVAYTRDDSPGIDVIDTTTTPPSFGDKTFEVIQQYVAPDRGPGLAVVLPDFSYEEIQDSDFGSNPALFNAGAAAPFNGKQPVTGCDTLLLFGHARWNPDRVYLFGAAGWMTVFDIQTGSPLNEVELGRDALVAASYYSQ